MAMMIKEYVGHQGIEVKWQYKAPVNVTEGMATAANYAPNSLMVEHEAIHVGPTRNYTWYTQQALEGSVPTWTFPYARPVIKHHNEENGDTIGRVVEVSYQEKSQISGTGYLKLIANVPDEKGKQDVQNGLLQTVSIGAIVHEAKCSICGHNIAEEGPCEHERGMEYDGKICYWMIEKMEAKEISYVIVPSDKYAQVTKFWTHNKIAPAIKESFDGQKGVKQMGISEVETQNNPTESVKDTQEGVIIQEEGQKEGASQEAEKAPETAVEETPAKDEAAEKEIETLKETIKTLETKVADLEKALTAKDATLQKEVAAKEALEVQMMTIQEAEKTELIKKVCSVKESLGLSASAEKLQTKSITFLKESLEDLQEELAVKEAAATAEAVKVDAPVAEVPTQIVQNPSIAENVEENKELVVKESTVNSNTFLDDMASIMSLSMNSRKF